MQPLLWCLTAASASALVAASRMIVPATAASARDGESRRIEFGGREGHVTEEMAGTAFLSRDTFLVGNGVLGSVDQILTGTDDPNDGKNTDGYGEITSVLCGIAKRSAHRAADVRRHVTATAATATLRRRFEDLGTKYDGIHDLNDGNRCVGSAAAELGRTAEIIVGRALEDADVALTAEEHNLLFQYRNAFEFLNASGADASLKGQLDVEFDVDGVKTAVEGDGCDVDLRPGDTGALDTDVGCVSNDVVAEIGQQDANVLKAIPITTGVENAVSLDTDRVSAGRGGAGEFVICHKRIPPCKMEALTGNALL